MAVQGGYDVSIGGYKFLLDETDTAYRHYFQSTDIEGEIVGEQRKRTVDSSRLIWVNGDWSGGEGQRIYYTDDPTTYDYAEALNGRIPGEITGRPLRESYTTTAGDRRKKCYLAIAGGVLWVGQNLTLKYSDDYGATWTDKTATLGAANQITAMVGTPDYLFVATGNATNQKVDRVKRTSAGVVTVANVQANETRSTFSGLAMLQGRLYGWSGRRLYEYDVAAGTLPLTLNKDYRKVYDTGGDIDYADYGGSIAGSWWGSIESAENSLVFWIGTEGQTEVYEWDGIAAFPLWHVPFGTTMKSMKVQDGELFGAGHYSGESVATGGFGDLRALNLSSRGARFVAWFRKTAGQNLQMQEMANSYGSQILIAAARLGKIFIYDKDFNSVSMLDDLAYDGAGTNKIGDMVTFGRWRIVASYEPAAANGTGDITFFRWKSDELADRESVGSLSHSQYSPTWDYGFPFDSKTLSGYHVMFEPLVANQRIILSYSLDGAAYVATTTITSATAGASSGRVFVPVATGANDPKFSRLKNKLTIDNNATTGVKQPIVYAYSPEVSLMNYAEIWDLVVRVKDEHQQRGRPTDRAMNGSWIRDNLETLATQKKIVTFLDGSRYADKPNHFTTHTVRIVSVADGIIRTGNEKDRSAEGTCTVRLKAIPI